MRRTLATVLIAVLLVTLYAWQSQGQPAQGVGPVYDPVNQAYRVNVVTGSSGGLSPSTFGTAFPSQGAAVGGQDPFGAFASFTISNTGRLQITCDNCSSSAATFGQGFPSNGGPGGYKDSLGAFASFTGQNGKQNIIIGNESTLSATVTSGNALGTVIPNFGYLSAFKDANGALASVSAVNRFPVTCDNCSSAGGTFGTAYPTSGSAIGYKDASGALASVSGSNGGLNVNILSGAGASANFGTAYPTAGTPGGYKDALGAFASFTGANGKQNVIVGNESTLTATVTGGNTVGATFPSTFLAIFRDALGAAASVTVSNSKANVIIGNESTLVATVTGGNVVGTSFPSQVLAIFRDALGATASVTTNNSKANVIVDSASNISATLSASNAIIGNVRTTSDSTLSATLSAGNAIIGNVRTTSDSTLSATLSAGNAIVGNVRLTSDSTSTATVTQGNAALLNATVTPSASYGTAHPAVGYPTGFKDANGALASVSTANRFPVTCDNCSSAAATFGTAYPTSGGASGYKDALGAFASVTGANGAANQTLRDSSGRELGSSLPGQQNVPVAVQQVPTLSQSITLGQRSTTIVNVPVGQATGTPIKNPVAVGGASEGGNIQPLIRCNRNASISATNAGFTQVVAAVGGQSVYVCGYTVVAATVPVGITFGYGTGTNCGTASSDLTGAMTVAASGGMVNTPSNVGVFETPPGQALCIKLSNGATVGGHLRYTYAP